MIYFKSADFLNLNVFYTHKKKKRIFRDFIRRFFPPITNIYVFNLNGLGFLIKVIRAQENNLFFFAMCTCWII